MKIKQLPIDPGPAAWNSILPPRRANAPLLGDHTADWVIIGAGFAGLTAAARLRQLDPKGRIAIFEAREVAEGPAGRNSGFMVDLPHDLASSDYGGGLADDMKTTRANRAAIDFAIALASEFGLPQEAINPCGKMNAAASAKGHQHNLDYAKHLADMGEDCSLYDAAQMQEITGIAYYQSGLFTPGAVMLQPAMYIRGIADGILRQGVQIYEQSPVADMQKAGSDWAVKTTGACITAPKVILAVNGHANSFGLFKRQLMHVFTYASMTRVLTADEIKLLGGQPVWGATPADPLGTTVRRISGTGGDRIIIRNRATYDPSIQVSDARIRAVGKTHDKSFTARFPMLKNVEMEYRWGGRLCLTRNNVSAFGLIEDGLYSACCQNGLGTAKGTLHGMLCADYAAGQESELVNQILTADAPTRLPPTPIAKLGATAILKWGEYKAGQEL